MEGKLDGMPDGTPDGMSDGKLDGKLDGRPDGISDGKLEGTLDGMLEGNDETPKEGEDEGIDDGKLDPVGVWPMAQPAVNTRIEKEVFIFWFVVKRSNVCDRRAMLLSLTAPYLCGKLGGLALANIQEARTMHKERFYSHFGRE